MLHRTYENAYKSKDRDSPTEKWANVRNRYFKAEEAWMPNKVMNGYSNIQRNLNNEIPFDTQDSGEI